MGQEGNERQGPNGNQGSTLSDRPRQGDNQPGKNATSRVWEHVVLYRLPLGGAESMRRFPDAVWNGADRPRAEVTTIGSISNARVKPAVKMLWPRCNWYTSSPRAG